MSTKVTLSQEDAIALIAKSLDQGNALNALAIVGDMMDSANEQVTALRTRIQALEGELTERGRLFYESQETVRMLQGELASYEARRSDLMARYTAMQLRAEQAEEKGQK